MSIHRRAARRDTNERQIIDALRAVGASVYPISAKQVPDLLVGWQGETILMEIKTKKGSLNEGQREFVEDWYGGRVLVIRSVEEALAALNITI